MVVFHFSAVIASFFVLQLEQDPLLLADAFLVREEIIFSHCQVGCLIHGLQLFCYIKLQSLYCEGRIAFNPSALSQWLLFSIAAEMPVWQHKTYSINGWCSQDIPSWLVRVTLEIFCTKLSLCREESGLFGGLCMH